MNAVKEIKQRLSHLSALSRLSEGEVQALIAQYPGLPAEYVQFLREVGYGYLGGVQLYSGLVHSPVMYPGSPAGLVNVLLFGDDLQGYCFGFDTTESFRVVEVDPRGSIDKGVERDFLRLLLGLLRRTKTGQNDFPSNEESRRG